jgi:hypothetical protein
VTYNRQSKQVFLENTVTFDYGASSGFQGDSNIDKILGDTGNNTICVQNGGGGLYLLHIEKTKKPGSQAASQVPHMGQQPQKAGKKAQ